MPLDHLAPAWETETARIRGIIGDVNREFSVKTRAWYYPKDGVTHFSADATSDASATDAQQAAEALLERIAGHRETYVRAIPCATSDRDFDTKTAMHRAFVRFSYMDCNGTRHLPEPSQTAGFGVIA